jgi:hypothetical protein
MAADSPGKGSHPGELWAAAVEAARRNGCNRTATALHLDGGKLRKQMLAAGAVGKKPAPPAFVELIAPEANSVAEYTIEGRVTLRCYVVIDLKAKAFELAHLSAFPNTNWRNRYQLT